MNLLVVDDHVDTAKLLCRVLTMAGHDVDIAQDARSALLLHQNHEYDVLLADVGLPDRSGWELMQELSRNGPIRGIAMSGFTARSDIEKSLKAGFSEHLTKPLSIEGICAAVRRVAEKPLLRPAI